MENYHEGQGTQSLGTRDGIRINKEQIVGNKEQKEERKHCDLGRSVGTTVKHGNWQ